MQYIDNLLDLNKKLESLELDISTVDANDGYSIDFLYVNIVFTDGTRLYEPENLKLSLGVFPEETGPLPQRGHSKRFKLPFKEAFPGDQAPDRTLGDIAEIYIRKSGDDGWFVGSVLLYANTDDLTLPLLGNSKVNQFLDDDEEVLFLRDWSTGSLSVPPAIPANHPLPRSGYRVLGPVIGHVSADSATVLYRVDREGNYQLTVTDQNNSVVTAPTLWLNPTGRFEVNGLQPGRKYKFDLSFIRGGTQYKVPDSAGLLLTYPEEGSRGRFTFAFGSCLNPEKQVAQGAWTAIRALAEHTGTELIDRLRLFVHLGDSFYFYDDYMDEVPVKHVETMQAAHLSMRRNIEFLDMARVVPCCGIWDDHDFAGDDLDSTSMIGILGQAVDTWLQYWGNRAVSPETMGLTTRISYGLVDLYLLDGRFNRDWGNGVCFGRATLNWLLSEIDARGDIDPRTNSAQHPRVVILASGSNWNHQSVGTNNYGDDVYMNEREWLYSQLARRMGSNGPMIGPINGLIFISGDNHVNEIFRVNLNGGHSAPEFVSSPLTRNSDLLDGQELEGERVASFSSKRYRGFATLTIDTSSETRFEWNAIVRYYQEAAANVYESFSYTLSNGQFNLL